MRNYEGLVNKISKVLGVDKSEVEKRIEAKRAKLSGLISREGAAQIIAAELNISFDEEDLKISQLMPGLKKVNVIGKVLSVFPLREFEKNGKKGYVLSFIISDDSASTRVVLWDTRHINMFQSGEIGVGDFVEIKAGSVRGDNEIHLSSFSDIKKSGEVIDGVIEDYDSYRNVSIEKVNQGQNVKVRGCVVQLFSPRFYFICPFCSKKTYFEEDSYRCLEHGLVTPKKKAVISMIIDDGTDNIRVSVFDEQLEKIVSVNNISDEAGFVSFRDNFLGTEVYVKGRVNKNALFGNLEVSANEIYEVDVEKLIEELSRET